MRQNDIWRDMTGALRLLTRLPLPHSAHIPGPSAAWAWPLVGLAVGGIAALVALLPFGVGVVAALVLGAQAMLTGAMHEDGLADTADGLWGGWDKARRLAIMKDSHIGTYGVVALLVLGLVRWSALVTIIAAGQVWVLVVAAVVSRAPMAVLMATMPSARGAGLAHAVGAVPRLSAGVAVGIAVAFGITLGAAGVLALLAVGAVVFVLARVAQAKIAGQTGDICGASQQLAEAVVLVVVAALL